MILFRGCQLLFLVILLTSGCRGKLGPYKVSDPDPSNKIPAIKIAAEQRDAAAEAQLVKDLDSDDPAVRFYAIHALKELAGEDFGYEYYFDEDQRKESVKKWQEWLAERHK